MDDSEKLLKEVMELAMQDSVGRKSKPTYSVYVIEIEKIDPTLKFEFYVGSTSKSIQYRFAQHVPEHELASKIFKRLRGKAKQIRWDLTLCFPKFHTRAAAEKAEGLLARAIQEAGWTVSSDRLNKE